MVDIRAKLSNGLKQITGTLAGTKVAIDTVLIDPNTGLPLETVPVDAGKTKPFRVTPEIDLTKYAAGDCVGGVQTIPGAFRVNGGGATLINAIINIVSATVHPDLQIILFNADPTASTTTDNSPFVLAAADIPKKIGSITVYSSNYILEGTGVYSANLTGIGQALEAAADADDLYVVIETKTTFTLASASALSLLLGLSQD